MISPAELAPQYAPLPVRARGTLEIFDTAFKLFRRYAKVLLAWSAIAGLINMIPIVGTFAYLFTLPLIYGAVSCAVAGAVRGQDVHFKQVWGFTKPRYGALLGVLILASILLFVVGFALLFVTSLGVALFVASAAKFGTFAQVVASIVGGLVALVGGSFLLAVVMGWFNIAPVIACLEDGNRGSGALSRAWSLLNGNWRKASAVATILTLAGTSAFLIVGGFVVFFFYGGWDKMLGANTDWASGLALSGVGALFFIAWTPLQAVVGAVFYLDLRTRKEALDLEWTNYAAKPETTPVAFVAAPPPPPTHLGPPYAPASALPALTNVPPPPPPVYSAAPERATPPPPPIVFAAPAPVEVASVAPPAAAPPNLLDQFAAQLDVTLPPAPTEVPPVAPAPPPPPAPAPPPPAPTASSSFAPPPRFRRERRPDEDDNPSSFGSSA